MTDDTTQDTKRPAHGYVLDEQVGFLLRKAWQRNTVIFAERMETGLTPTQFSVMYRLSEVGSVSQNQLGRSVAMDGATTKGVVDRLIGRGLLTTRPDPDDRRRHLVSLTAEGREVFEASVMTAHRVTAETLAPLTAAEQRTLVRLLAKIQ
ncbi:MarR family winged helix-turn-helix transcriptional regulator [Oceanicella sp. SM1341]|uniref:MarR family winged helix-turn-helix transcriptional regulator n=1 Tax=Oceanicella sp. SM1341 TaxID=1548889 RepID=UPI001E2D5BA9|nr:MarR family transcriptional regulator [Oceanicella sp. SM1341]